MTGVAALAFAATFTSCSKTDLYDEGRQEKDKEVATKKDFASQFEAKAHPTKITIGDLTMFLLQT